MPFTCRRPQASACGHGKEVGGSWRNDSGAFPTAPADVPCYRATEASLRRPERSAADWKAMQSRQRHTPHGECRRPANAAWKSDGLNCPQRSGPEEREGRPRGQFRRSRLPCAKGRVCGERAGAQRIHGRCSLAERHPAHGESRRRGVAGTPAGMGSRKRCGFCVGKVFSPILNDAEKRSAIPAHIHRSRFQEQIQIQFPPVAVLASRALASAIRPSWKRKLVVRSLPIHSSKSIQRRDAHNSRMPSKPTGSSPSDSAT